VRGTRSGDPDIGGHDPQRAAGVRDLEVVDSHDFSAVDVDDLFVEQILDQVERHVVGGSRLGRCGTQYDRAARIDVEHVANGREAFPALRFHEQPVDFRKRVVRFGDKEVDDFPNRAMRRIRSQDRVAADELRKVTFLKRHARSPPSRPRRIA
jgi:hypothetical protein